MSHLRSTVTLCVLVAVFVVGTFVGFKLLTADVPSLATESDTPTCKPRTIQSGAKLGAGQVTVDIFNASTSSGLAHRTLTDLEKNGFLPGEIGNAPESVKHIGNVLIATDDNSSAAVRLVKKQFRGKVKVRKPEEKLGAGVRVILGKKFKGVKKNAPKSITAKKATKVCVLVEPSVQGG
ncbi:MAG: LytR C-terminal domain-containing protein [Nocardioidaceae bacterium]